MKSYHSNDLFLLSQLRRLETQALNLLSTISRTTWLWPPDIMQTELRERTLTNLYNKRPTWLANAHHALDRAVCAAYGFAFPIDRSEILRQLLSLNCERASGPERLLNSDLPPKKEPAVERLPRQMPSIRTRTR